MKNFSIPNYFKSPVIARVKKKRQIKDRYKRDYKPTLMEIGPFRFFLARHFGLCFGVENAIDIAYRAVLENPKKRIFLLSEMIHNARVNSDLLKLGVRFLRNTEGKQIIDLEDLKENDVVIIPAFGSSVDDEERLKSMGLKIYNTTCPFVTRVWNKIEAIGKKDYTIIVHGKVSHEETRGTFSRACLHGNAALIIQNREEVRQIGRFIAGHMDEKEFSVRFSHQSSCNFQPAKHLSRIGLVNQTTMLANETQLFSRYLRGKLIERYGVAQIDNHFYDTKDTLCYATNENQRASKELLKTPADLAIVIGGYNSSNTSHLYYLLKQKVQSYYISSAKDIIDKEWIQHLDYPRRDIIKSHNWLSKKVPITILLSAGASSPDILVEEVIQKISSFIPRTSKKTNKVYESK